MEIGFDLRMVQLGGGGWTYSVQLLEHLLRQDGRTDWRLYHNPWSEPQQRLIASLRAEFPSLAGRLHLQPVKSGCLSLAQHLEFKLFRSRSAVYHYPHFDMPLGMNHIPLVMTIHDLYPLVLPGYCRRAKREYFRLVTRRNALRAGRVIAVSHATRHDIIEHLRIPPEKIEVIWEGHSPAFKPIDDSERLESVRRRLRLPERFILFAGNHKPHKNLARLIEAYARLEPDLRAAFALVFVGPISAETEGLLARATALQVQPRVFFTGVLEEEDLPPVFNLASLLVQPSLYEGFGLPPLEAMACGKPVAGARAGALPEVVGGSGRLFDPYSVEEMASVLAQALRQDVDNPATRAEVLLQAAKFTWEETARKTWMIYNDLAH